MQEGVHGRRCLLLTVRFSVFNQCDATGGGRIEPPPFPYTLCVFEKLMAETGVREFFFWRDSFPYVTICVDFFNGLYFRRTAIRRAYPK